MSWRLARRRNVAAELGWPGFVDALSSLLLVIIFLLALFALAQFFLSQALSGRDETLAALRQDLAELSNVLALERANNQELASQIASLTATLGQVRDQNRSLSEDLASVNADLAEARRAQSEAQDDIAELSAERLTLTEALEAEQQVSRDAQEEVARLNQNLEALRAQLASLQEALEAAEAKDAQQEAIIADLGRRLNTALAGKVAELVSYRSEFFGRMREILGERNDIIIEGDRFIFQSEVLFDSGSAALKPEGQEQLLTFARTLMDLADEFPSGLDWILRVDGHTDDKPISTPRYPSNWELSTARALSVVRFLIQNGVPPRRLAAAGFGAHQPIAQGDNPAIVDYLNRRIELRLDQR